MKSLFWPVGFQSMVTYICLGLVEPQYMKEAKHVVGEDCSLPGGRKTQVLDYHPLKGRPPMI